MRVDVFTIGDRNAGTVEDQIKFFRREYDI